MSLEKVMSLSCAVEEADKQRLAGKRVVLTNGCFDLLHVGHVRYLQAARAYGDVLIVAVNGDESVRMLKGPGRPINSETDRAEVLAGLEVVGMVTIFHSKRVTEVIKALRPEVYVKGGDYTPESLCREEFAALQEVGTQIEIVGLVEGKSTTAVVSKMTGGNLK